MKLAFTTLGCPAWDPAAICAKARAYGCAGLDCRGPGGPPRSAAPMPFTG